MTFRARFWRAILAEFNTHAAFCLAGDQVLEFDSPGGRDGRRVVRRMTIADFVDKWEGGARRVTANPKAEYSYAGIRPIEAYDADEAAMRTGMTNSPINTACRQGKIRNAWKDGRKWVFYGEDFLAWRRSRPEHTRFGIRERLASMRIRQLNEATGVIQCSTVVGVSRSGPKEVFEVRAGEYVVAGSRDHRIMTADGWKAIGDLTTRDKVVVRKFGKLGSGILDPTRLQKIGGRWRSAWQREMRRALALENPICRDCGLTRGQDIHHIEPVHANPARAFDETNITLLCELCHHRRHASQGWQGGTYLYGAAAQVESITSRGIEETYDLEIAGEFPNFIANGVVVHNSRNSESSRAVPVARRIERVREDPYIPIHWGAEKPGMNPGATIADPEIAEGNWRAAARVAATAAGDLVALGVHKSIVNRLLEPFLWHEVVFTTVDLDNFLNQRDHKDADPNMQALAREIRKAADASVPVVINDYDWHLPFVGQVAKEVADSPEGERLKWISAGRCASISYDINRVFTEDQDYARGQRCKNMGHWSPLAHQVTPKMPDEPQKGNLPGWCQLRHFYDTYELKPYKVGGNGTP